MRPPARGGCVLLRSLFSGIYTIDNMDFVLRDAYMSGYNARAFDLERLLHYSFFTPQGLTIHSRGMAALVQFMGVRADLFRTIYFHRTVRAIDLTLADLFAESKDIPVPRQPAGTPRRLPPVHRVVAAGRRRPLALRATTRASASWAARWQDVLESRSSLEDGLPAQPRVHGGRDRAEQHFQPCRFRRARAARAACRPELTESAAARRPGAAHPSPRHAGAGRGPELLLGRRPAANLGRCRTINSFGSCRSAIAFAAFTRKTSRTRRNWPPRSTCCSARPAAATI